MGEGVRWIIYVPGNAVAVGAARIQDIEVVGR
jgi:hypothetical protein